MKLRTFLLLALLAPTGAFAASDACTVEDAPFDVDIGGSHFKVRSGDREIGFVTFDGLAWYGAATGSGGLDAQFESKQAATIAVCRKAG